MLEERKVAVGELRVGMYVCRLDREWVGTPFPLQWLRITSPQDIDALAQWCRHVYIDIERSDASALPPPRAAAGPHRPPVPKLPPRRRPAGARREYSAAETEALRSTVVWTNTVEFEDELPAAREAQQQAAEQAARILDDVRDGRPISTEEVRQAVEPMVRSVLRNMDAFMWLESLRKRDAYDYQHAINCSALAAAFGRHVGFPEDIVTDMAAGGLLLDVGKLRIDQALFARNGPLDPTETALVRTHVQRGLELIDDGDPLPLHVEEMIRTHHERVDGSGYPQQLSGTEIPLLGRIAAVIDSYDAMISDRSHAVARSRHEALQELYRARNSHYAAEIVEQFMQCLSVYPTGSLVELSDGRVAVVMAQNAARRLRPRVMVLTDGDKTLAPDFVSLDLAMQAEGSVGLSIIATLQPGDHGLDPRDLYL